jgi:hypothetical protein
LNRRHKSRSRLPHAVALGVATAALLAGAAPAAADTAVLTVTTTTGQSDPAAGVPRIFTLSGSTSLPKYLFVKFRATGGAPCGPSASSDSGTYLQTFDPYERDPVNGAFNLQEVFTWDTAGDVFFCMWLSDTADAISTPIAQVVSFRAPTAALSGTVNPVRPQPGQLATATITGTTETPATLEAKIRGAGGAPCAPTPSSDTGDELIEGIAVNGAFTTTATVTQQSAGSYLICLWLTDYSSSLPIAGPQPVIFGVGAPPPPPPLPMCVVPGVRHNAPLHKVKRRIRAKHCRVGRIVRIRSRTVVRGGVIRLRPRSRTRLAEGTRVKIVVSKGWPRHGHRHRHR